ncbi:MAG: hypothetical protein DI539_10700 [Flavobacterium psychrophilum]|nr:MAG: hypothetical protein DI539_10700 [Flavobacterium psychrophilum]
MEAINIQATKWSSLPDIDSVVEFNDDDAACLKEIRDVLKKHSRLERFGISLLHTHFDVEEDEILFETTNVIERTQLIRPVKVKDLKEREDLSMMTTCLKLVDEDSVAMQYCGCLRDHNGHTGEHDPPLHL